MHNRIVLDPYAHYPLMQFPHNFALKGVYFELWNNHTGLGTYYHDCGQAGGYRTHIDFDQIDWVDYKLFPITPITPAQVQDLVKIVHNPQPQLTLHLSLEELDCDYPDYYLAPLVPIIKSSPKPVDLEIITRGELNQWRRARTCQAIELLFRPLQTVQSLIYMHSVDEDNQFLVDLASGSVEPKSQIDKW